MPIKSFFFFDQRWIIGWPQDRKKTFKEEEAQKKKDMERQRKYAIESNQASLKAKLDLLFL